MPTIIFSPLAQLSQVEDFPDDCERTVKGAIYVRPGATSVVSDGEAAHLKARGVIFSVSGEPGQAPGPVQELPKTGARPLPTATGQDAPSPDSEPQPGAQPDDGRETGTQEPETDAQDGDSSQTGAQGPETRVQADDSLTGAQDADGPETGAQEPDDNSETRVQADDSLTGAQDADGPETGAQEPDDNSETRVQADDSLTGANEDREKK